ncbi:NAD-dependent epimerase/dehydratase family protein [Nitrosopumilus sp. S4]
MKILITGGAGFIGRHLIDFLKKNHTVLVYDNLSNSDKLPDGKNVKFLRGDVLDFEKLAEFSNGTDAVIHLAAISNVVQSISQPDITRRVNVDGTANVLQCCAKNKIKKIIFASSAAVYGDYKDIITEETKTNPLSPYGKSKLEAEKMIVDFSKENKIEHIIFRMFNVYGKGQNKDYAGVVDKFLKNISEDKPISIYGNGEQTRDFVSISDVVDAFDLAIKSDRSDTYNIASGKSISINELAKNIFDVLGKKVEIKYFDKQIEDIQNSIADVSLAKKYLEFVAKRKLKDEIPSIYP